jgi:hypothetical protein
MGKGEFWMFIGTKLVRRRMRASSTMIAALVIVGFGHGQVNNWQWQSGGGNNWSNASNWSFDATGASGLYGFVIGLDSVNSPPYGFTQISTGSYEGLYLQSSVGLNISGGSLQLTDPSAPNFITGTLSMSGGSFFSAAAVAVNNFTWSGGSLAGAGAINVSNAFTMNAASGTNLTIASTLNIAGTGTWSNASSVDNTEGAINVLNGASLTLNGAGTINNGSFSNAGTLTYNATSVPSSPGYYGIEATVATNSGTVINTGTSDGDFWAATTVSNTGTFTNLATGANYNGTGNWMTIGAENEMLNKGTIQTSVAGSGLEVYSNNGLVDNENTIEASSPNSYLFVIGNSEVLNNGMILLTGANDLGSVYATNGPTINNGSIILVGSGGLDLATAGPELNNSGTIAMFGDGDFNSDATTITNSGLIQAGGFNENGAYGPGDMYLGSQYGVGTITNSGSIIVDGYDVSGTAPSIRVNDSRVTGSTFTNTSTGSITARNGGTFHDGSTTASYAGSLAADFGGAFFLGASETNSGSINLYGGSYLYAGNLMNSGALIVSNGSFASANVYNSGSISITDDSQLSGQGSGQSNSGTISIDATSTAQFAGGYVQEGQNAETLVKGRLTLSGGPLTLGTGVNAGDGGLLTGNGTIIGAVDNLSGTVSPGDPNILTIEGSYLQGVNGVLSMDIAGPGGAGAANGYDQLDVSGSVTLNGTLDLTISPSFTGGTVDLLTYGGALDISNSLRIVDLSNPNLQFELMGSGGDLVLEAVPEPAGFLPLGMGLGYLAFRRRRAA